MILTFSVFFHSKGVVVIVDLQQAAAGSSPLLQEAVAGCTLSLMLPGVPLHSFGCCRVPLCFVPLISRWLSAQYAKAAAVLIGLLSCLFRSVAGMKWDLWAGSWGWSWGRQLVDQTMMKLPSLPHGNPVEMQFRLTFHLVNNVSLTIWPCLLLEKSAWQLHLLRRICPDQGRGLWLCICLAHQAIILVSMSVTPTLIRILPSILSGHLPA